MRQKLIRIAAAALVLLSVVGIAPRFAKADTVTISPPKFELFGNPGDVLKETIKVRNDSDVDGTYQTTVEDFRAQGDDGSIDLVDPQSSKESYSLTRWITVDPAQFTVPAGQEKILNYTIKIPKTGEPGGHYASVLVTKAGDNTPGGATVESRIGTLILLRVSGATTEKLTLENFKSENGFQQFGPVTFDMRYKNEGNVHVAPTGTIIITNMFGQKVKEIPVSPANVLPESERLIKTNFDEKNLLGSYTATLAITYGQGKETIAGTTTFFVFPFYLMGIIVVVLVFIYLLVAKRKDLKRFLNKLTSD